MGEADTTSGGRGPETGSSPGAQRAGEIAEGPNQSGLVGTNRTVDPALAGPLAHLRAAREALDQAEYWIGVIAHELHHLPDQKARVNQARTQTQGAHGLLWDVSRDLAAGGPGEPL